MATADVSEPPLPRVVTLPYSLKPWKPVTRTIFFSASSFLILTSEIFEIFATL